MQVFLSISYFLPHNINEEVGSNTTEQAVEEGRYIKGDPLNGYYDFVITEGSYKFWVVFQVSASEREHDCGLCNPIEK